MKKIVTLALTFIYCIAFAAPVSDASTASNNSSGQPKLIMVKPANGSSYSQAQQSRATKSKKGNKHKSSKKSHSKTSKNYKQKNKKQHKHHTT